MPEKFQNTLASVEGRRYNIDERTVAAICDILRRGNAAEIRRNGDGHTVFEVKTTIKYRTP